MLSDGCTKVGIYQVGHSEDLVIPPSQCLVFDTLSESSQPYTHTRTTPNHLYRYYKNTHTFFHSNLFIFSFFHIKRYTYIYVYFVERDRRLGLTHTQVRVWIASSPIEIIDLDREIEFSG